MSGHNIKKKNQSIVSVPETQRHWTESRIIVEISLSKKGRDKKWAAGAYLWVLFIFECVKDILKYY